MANRRLWQRRSTSSEFKRTWTRRSTKRRSTRAGSNRTKNGMQQCGILSPRFWMRRRETSLCRFSFRLRRRLRVSAPSIRSRKDRKSTRLNSSHVEISYAVFCLKKKKNKKKKQRCNKKG